MSKNFEEEYKALASEDLPDLWNRIEAGLTERTTALAEDGKDGRTAKEDLEDRRGSRDLKKVTAFLYRYRTVAAAALCAVAIIPAAIFLGRSGRNKTWEAADDTAQPADTAMYEATAEDSEESVLEEAAEGGEAVPETAMEAETDEAAAVTEDYDGGARAGGAADVEDLLDETAEAVSEEEMEADNASNDEATATKQFASESAKTEMMEDKTVTLYEQVTVKVIQITEETVQADRDFFYGVEMEVVKDPSGELEEGEEIMVWISMLSSQAYLEGEEYTLDLSYEADRECPYRIV